MSRPCAALVAADIRRRAAIRAAFHRQFVVRDRLDLVGKRVPSWIIPLATKHRLEAVIGDRHRKLPNQQSSQLEGGMQLAEKVEQQPGRVAARHGDRLRDNRPHLLEIASDHGEQPAGGVGKQVCKRLCLDANTQIGRVLKDGKHQIHLAE